jgi:hypothetical protein
MNVTPEQIQAAKEGKVVELTVNGHSLYLLNHEVYDRTSLGNGETGEPQQATSPTEMQAACDRMDQIREENRRRFGVQDIGVEIIREMRDSR